MAKIVIYNLKGEGIKEIEIKGCKHKVNGICYNNGDYKKLGKKCYNERECEVCGSKK